MLLDQPDFMVVAAGEEDMVECLEDLLQVVLVAVVVVVPLEEMMEFQVFRLLVVVVDHQHQVNHKMVNQELKDLVVMVSSSSAT
jgi:hypothetical protein